MLLVSLLDDSRALLHRLQFAYLFVRPVLGQSTPSVVVLTPRAVRKSCLCEFHLHALGKSCL